MVGQCSTCPGRWPGCSGSSPVCPSCSASSACRVPGMNGQEWENGSKKKRKRNNNKKNAKNEVAANNMFEALANENEDDMEFIVPTKPEVVFRTFFGRSSVGNDMDQERLRHWLRDINKEEDSWKRFRS